MIVTANAYIERNEEELWVSIEGTVSGARGQIEEITVERAFCPCGCVLELTPAEYDLCYEAVRDEARKMIDDLRDRAMGT